jgi:hypothetical protein
VDNFLQVSDGSPMMDGVAAIAVISTVQGVSMHPMIKPALRRGWHDRGTVRYGVTPAHSVLLGPLDGPTETFLTLLDGTRGLPALRA